MERIVLDDSSFFWVSFHSSSIFLPLFSMNLQELSLFSLLPRETQLHCIPRDTESQSLLPSAISPLYHLWLWLAANGSCPLPGVAGSEMGKNELWARGGSYLGPVQTPQQWEHLQVT